MGLRGRGLPEGQVTPCPGLSSPNLLNKDWGRESPDELCECPLPPKAA